MTAPTQTLWKSRTQRAGACWLCCLILFGFLEPSVRAQSVLEASLSTGTTGEAQLMMGKLWLNFDAQGSGQFQAVVARVLGGYVVVSAQLEVAGAAADLPFGQGEERTYAGCDPLGWNPYLSLPAVFSSVTCPALMVGQFHEGQFALNAGMAGELLAERGI